MRCRLAWLRLRPRYPRDRRVQPFALGREDTSEYQRRVWMFASGTPISTQAMKSTAHWAVMSAMV